MDLRTPSIGSLDASTSVSAINTGIRFEGVSHWYTTGAKPRIVVCDVTFKVPENQFIAIVGPSGCGKTTVLNMIAGLISPEKGLIEVNIGGQFLSRPSTDIGYMWARDALLPWRTLVDNVEFGLQLRDVPYQERRSRALDAIKLVGLKGSEQQHPRELSHGMRQRGNLARMLAINPRLFLLDEPFSALDAQTKNTLQKEFSSIWHNDPRTVVYVTHDLTEAALLSDRILVMVNGRIRRDIPVPFNRPRSVDELRFDGDFQLFTRELWNLLATLKSETKS